MGQMMKLLKEKDPTLHKHLVSHLYSLELQNLVWMLISIFLSAAKGWYGPNLLWISLDHSPPLSGISPPW